MSGDDRPPPLDYRPPGRDGSIWTRPIKRSGLWLALAAVMLVVWSMFAPTTRPPGDAYAARARSQLHQIGLAIEVFRSEHGGRYPDSLADVVADSLTMPDVVSRLSSDTPATTPTTSPTTREAAAALAVPGHCSYVYVGRGLNDRTATATTVVAYDRVADHGGAGCNVYYGDGHVDWLDAKHAATLPTTTTRATDDR